MGHISRKQLLSMSFAVALCLLCLDACGGGSSTPPPPPPPNRAVLVSGASPFPEGCEGGSGATPNHENGEAEAWLAADPADSSHLVGIYQQDRWRGGGAHGLMIAVTEDGGKTWTRDFAPFARCAGGNPGNNGNYERASDPWVTISPDGTVYQSGLSFDAVADANQATQISRSTDGGKTWSNPTPLIADTDPTVTDDKDSMIADPIHNGYAYVAWSRYTYTDATQSLLVSSPILLSRTTDGGETWQSPPEVIYNPPAGFYATGIEMVVLPNGTLVGMFIQYDATTSAYYTISSTDHGGTWSAPVLLDMDDDIGVTDVKTGEPVREGVSNIAVNPTTGDLYFVSMDARFSSGVRNGIIFYTSTDGGQTWSAPVQINQAPNVQAFAPSIAISASGKIAVAYYDFRNDNSDPNVLLTNYWRITSTDRGKTWSEISLSYPFDLRTAPLTGLGYMVTDYEGIVAVGNSFTEFFVLANSGDAANPTDVFATSTESPVGSMTIPNEHVEINLFPRSVMQQWHPSLFYP